MMKSMHRDRGAVGRSSRSVRWLVPFVVALVAGFLIRLMSGSGREERAANSTSDKTNRGTAMAETGTSRAHYSPRRIGPANADEPTAEVVLARRMQQFGRNRRELVHALARHFGMEVPDDVERFFEAVEGGRWEEIDAAHRALLLDEKQLNQPRDGELHKIWRPIQEAWGIFREAQSWPAQKILDYGNELLGSLRPG